MESNADKVLVLESCSTKGNLLSFSIFSFLCVSVLLDLIGLVSKFPGNYSLVFFSSGSYSVRSENFKDHIFCISALVPNLLIVIHENSFLS